MERLRRWSRQPGWIEGISIGGLLIAIAAAGVVGLITNAQINAVTDEVLAYDIELEDRGDDFRVAVLDMRHFHRNITFAGPTRGGLADFDAAHLQLQQQIDRLEELGIRDPTAPQPEQLRSMVDAYYAQFRPQMELYNSERQAFALASDSGLVQLSALENAAQTLDRLGEQSAAAALRDLESAETAAQTAMLTVLGGLILAGAGLAYLIVSNLRVRQRTAVQLAQALRLKNDFIADASHELRTPLTVLRANAEVALDLDRTCVHTEFLEEIVRESERMTHLVEDLLLLARSDSESLPLETKQLAVLPFFAGLAERASLLAQEHDSELQTELRATGLVRIDPRRIEQVVLILVDNAGKFSPAGEPVMLRSRLEANELVVEVADRGPGISPKDLPLIFERFYRVDKARRRTEGGAGLGLAIARSIIEAHGGRIEAESVLGHGTTIRFFLPLATTALPEFA